MTPYDAVVVGLGPAGSVAARALALAGARVVALERARHPRRKPCGGALSSRIAAVLPPGYGEVVEARHREVEVRLPDGSLRRGALERDCIEMVLRPRFDAWLVREAARAGAEVREGVGARAVREGGDGVVVETDAGEVRAGFVVGADGFDSLVARGLGLRRGQPLTRLVEAELAPPGGDPFHNSNILELSKYGVVLDFAALRGRGYGWVFPKGAQLSAGVGDVWPGAAGDGEAAAAWRPFRASRPELSGAERERVGYRLPVFAGAGPIASRRALLVGDAAGFVDPLIGEGIYWAALSGSLAALGPERYAREVRRRILPELRAAQLLASIVYLAPSAADRLLGAHPRALRGYLRVLAGEWTMSELVGRLFAGGARLWVTRS